MEKSVNFLRTSPGVSTPGAISSDFFIHKDLKGFLTRELDFYLKNEVLNLDNMEASGEERTEGWFQT